jgi:hypothetical protein
VIACVLGALALAPAGRVAAVPAAKGPNKQLAPAPHEVRYVEECTVRFRDDPRKHPADPAGVTEAESLVKAGDERLEAARRGMARNASADVVTHAALDALESYRDALVRDPYSPPATLQLALAYDLTLRKGCALALLKRLAVLTQHPARGREARTLVDAVADNLHWFPRYRKDAMTAIDF